jgi:small subunit ribosomal protein S9
MVKMEQTLSSGKRKEAIARAQITPGSGIVRINSMLLENVTPMYAREKIRLPLRLAEGMVDINKIDIDLKVMGGGIMGQADAIASAIARGLVAHTKNDELHDIFVKYERTLIAGDHRQTEVHKPSQSSKGPRHKRQKSYR